MRSVRLKMLATVNPTCQRFESLPDDAEIAFVPMEGVGFNTLEPEARSKADVATGYTRFENGDVLLPKIAPTFAHGRVVAATGLTRGVGTGTTELHVLRPGPDVDARWLRYVMLSEPFLQQGIASYYGVAGQKRISLDWLVNYRAPLIPRDEQRRIADYLDARCARIDAFGVELDRQLRLARERRDAAFEDCFTAAGSRAWPLKYLLAERPRYGVLVPDFTSDGDGVPFVRVGDLASLKASTIELPKIKRTLSMQFPRTVLRGGEVLLGVVGNMGQAALVPGELAGANVARAVAVVRPGNPLPAPLLLHWFQSQQFLDQANRATSGDSVQPTLGMADLAGFRIRLPSDQDTWGDVAIELSTSATWLVEIERELANSRRLLAEHRSTLITAAVTGQFDVSSAA